MPDFIDIALYAAVVVLAEVFVAVFFAIPSGRAPAKPNVNTVRILAYVCFFLCGTAFLRPRLEAWQASRTVDRTVTWQGKLNRAEKREPEFFRLARLEAMAGYDESVRVGDASRFTIALRSATNTLIASLTRAYFHLAPDSTIIEFQRQKFRCIKEAALVDSAYALQVAGGYTLPIGQCSAMLLNAQIRCIVAAIEVTPDTLLDLMPTEVNEGEDASYHLAIGHIAESVYGKHGLAVNTRIDDARIPSSVQLAIEIETYEAVLSLPSNQAARFFREAHLSSLLYPDD